AAELSDPAAMPLDPARAEANFDGLEKRVREALGRQGLNFTSVQVEREIDMRYTMQLAEVATTIPEGSLDSSSVAHASDLFEQRYADLYGKDSGFREAGIQAITYRVRATGVLPFSPTLPELKSADSADASIARIGTRKVNLDGRIGYVDTDIYDYSKLAAGHVLAGPAIVEVPTTTVVVPHGTTGTVDRLGNLNIVAG
ncbi:hydantoinase, partial [Rhodococcus sp. 05-2254-6]